MGKFKGFKFKLPVIPEAVQVNIPQPPIPVGLHQPLANWVFKMQKNNIIGRSQSDFNSPVYVIKKRSKEPVSDTNTRVIMDGRFGNDLCLTPTMSTQSGFKALQNIATSKPVIFTSLDMANSYHHVEYEDELSRDLTTFTFNLNSCTLMQNGKSPNGKYRMLRTSISQSCSSYALSKAIEMTFQGLGFVVHFSDDVSLNSTSFDSHLKHLEQALQRVKEYGWLLRSGKCRFATSSLTFVGFHIDKDKITPDPLKIPDIENLSPPKNIRQILGFFCFFKDLIPDFTNIEI